MTTHRLLEGTRVSLKNCSAPERAFLRKLQGLARRRVSYFEIFRVACGPHSVALGYQAGISPETIKSPLYLAARDIATRAGIQQGLLLPYEDQVALDAARNRHGILFNVVQAAKHIGITKAAVYKAIKQGTLAAIRIGSMTLITGRSANAYKKNREKRAA